ncbi:MAG: hypothetical protein G01um101418_736 [Parcubacteria group bacterium Gr01-1014_18]|nr:MAG: hypothetical protein Greene041636_726 [Parcubacteria group bacterium Greene0416_36]TSC80228.1 MAG: hypothetical protein G01um101418_736 [Parcubacteria group bacterium Gr01-1014_18]TSC98410.1 MAG: hypothetical protein Greene101420_763 [Parcubacteria group bacterium Greene1014_20]TSD06951.1 MAG: hypothetical protein Greene07142_514 [Parcubacteria group bacterium Greene0714_2]
MHLFNHQFNTEVLRGTMLAVSARGNKVVVEEQ